MRFPGFFDEEFKLERISTLGDPLERLNQVVNWETFSGILLNAMQSKERKGAGGRPAYNPILMFKILILQRLYNLSDDQTEFQINDRLSFMRFLGLGLSDKVPDAKTIWLFRETLKNSGAAEELFSVFRDHLQAEGIITHTGSIVDASIIERRRQHIGKEAYTQLKEGKTPDEWQKPENQNKVRQVDKEARNRQRTPIRARVEHVFGSMKGSMKCGIIRCVGLLRTQFQLFMLGLVYNMKRYGFELQKLATKHT
jgi:IS5 family transposase